MRAEVRRCHLEHERGGEHSRLTSEDARVFVCARHGDPEGMAGGGHGAVGIAVGRSGDASSAVRPAASTDDAGARGRALPGVGCFDGQGREG